MSGATLLSRLWNVAAITVSGALASMEILEPSSVVSLALPIWSHTCTVPVSGLPSAGMTTGKDTCSFSAKATPFVSYTLVPPRKMTTR